MLYGLAGASGTGKTTLGRKVGDALGIPFVATSVTEMARECGYEATADLPLAERIDLQSKMLALFSKKIRAIEGNAILDRTPLDMIGYLLGEIRMNSAVDVPVALLEAANEIVGKCQTLTRLSFDHVFITSILDSYKEADNRPGYNPAYQRHVDLIIRGSAVSGKGIRCSFLHTTDLDRRMEHMIEIIGDRINEIDTMKKTSRTIH